MRWALVVLAACGGAAPTTPSNTTPVGSPGGAPVAEPARAASPPATQGEPRAITEVDDADPRSIDAAIKAADAAGQARDASAIDDLGALALRPPTKRLIAAQIAALRALGKMTTAKSRAFVALAPVIARELPPRPTKRDEEEAYALHLAPLGAAINALGELAEPRAAALLVPVIYRAPELSQQLRRAFAATSAASAAEFRQVLHGEHVAVEALLRDRKLDQDCSETPCRPLGLRDFYAALVLGDVRDASAVPDLLAALDRPPLPPYVVDGVPAALTQHNAIFDALRKIGAPDAAPKVKALWSKGAVETRTLAAATYAFVARDGTGSEALWKIAADNTADDGLRVEAATAFARLARDPKAIRPFLDLAKKYTNEAAKRRAVADKQQATKRAADAELAIARDALDAAKAKLLATTQDPATTADQIRAQTEAAKRAEAAFKAAKKQHRDKTAPFTQAEAAAKSYVAYARMFQTHVARIELAARCADIIDCYAGALTMTASEAARQVKPHIADVEQWTDEEKQGLVAAYVDRALLELGKHKATAKLDAVLAALASEDRLIRDAILLVLPKLAPSPCPACIAKLDAAIERSRSKPYLAAMQLETEIVRNYLASR